MLPPVLGRLGRNQPERRRPPRPRPCPSRRRLSGRRKPVRLQGRRRGSSFPPPRPLLVARRPWRWWPAPALRGRFRLPGGRIRALRRRIYPRRASASQGWRQWRRRGCARRGAVAAPAFCARRRRRLRHVHVVMRWRWLRPWPAWRQQLPRLLGLGPRRDGGRRCPRGERGGARWRRRPRPVMGRRRHLPLPARPHRVAAAAAAPALLGDGGVGGTGVR